MILLFSNKSTNKSHSTGKNSNIKNHPIENSGILANGKTIMRSLLAANEYDMYMFSQQAEVDYSMYSEGDNLASSGFGFMSEFSDAYSTLSESVSYSADSFGGGCDCCCSSGFSSFC